MYSRSSPPIVEPRADRTVTPQQQRRADSDSEVVGRDHLLDLHRAFGNRHVRRMVEQAAMPRRLIVGPADDRYEREADRIAQQVVGPLAPTASASTEATEAAPWVRRAIHNARGGQRLPDPLRSSMEQALGADLRGVRVHADAQADELNDALDADAFTTGRHLFFRRGAYAPQSRHGQSLLAHELTHVAQQGGPVVGHAGPSQRLIQRRISYKAKRIKKFVPRLRIKNRIFETLYDTLKAYERAPDADVSAQLARLQELEVLATEWLAKHGFSNKGQAAEKAPEVQTMLKDVRSEIDALAQERGRRYLQRVVATSWATFPGDNTTSTTSSTSSTSSASSSSTMTEADAADISARDSDLRFQDRSVGAQFNFITKTGAKAMSLFGAKHQIAKQSAQGHGLTDDELAAIRVFTSGDYKYMNPVQAESESRLSWQIKNLSQTKGNETTWALEATRNLAKSGALTRAQTRGLKVEALQHVRQAMSGLNRLPFFSGTLYRGLKVSDDDFDRDYQKGCVVGFPSLTSTSKDRAVSTAWAQTHVPDRIGVLLVLSGVTQGKDVASISTNEVEREVLLLAGARFVVTEAPSLLPNKVWEVKCAQVDAGSTQVGLSTPPAPTTTAVTASTDNTSSVSSSSSSAAAPAYLAPPPTASTSPTSTLAPPNLPPPPARRGRREAVRRYVLTEPLRGDYWFAGDGSTIEIVGLSEDRSEVQVVLPNSSYPPQWVRRALLERAIGRHLGLDN